MGWRAQVMMRYTALVVSLFVALLNMHLAATRPFHSLLTTRRGIAPIFHGAGSERITPAHALPSAGPA